MTDKTNNGKVSNQAPKIERITEKATPLSAGIPMPNSRNPLPPSGAARPVHDTLPPPKRKPK